MTYALTLTCFLKVVLSQSLVLLITWHLKSSKEKVIPTQQIFGALEYVYSSFSAVECLMLKKLKTLMRSMRKLSRKTLSSTLLSSKTRKRRDWLTNFFQRSLNISKEGKLVINEIKIEQEKSKEYKKEKARDPNWDKDFWSILVTCVCVHLFKSYYLVLAP